MHCHLIVSRKDQSNKKKLSPLTNHKNTHKGTVKGGFDRKNLFQQAEQGFDKLFSYNRPLTESFEYYNTMKKGSISDQLNMQEQQIASEKENIQTGIHVDKQYKLSEDMFAYKQDNNLSNDTENKQSINIPDLGLSSVLGLLTLDVTNKEEEQIPVKRKNKEPKPRLKR